ncbi:zinc-binding alcohol dehydrogenase family protein [bacterium AH-315-E10]|nr:zinc-binding alcohol dehydrogenase family protein [bacterium AH-315-E10]MBN4073964.1 zinc-binding alcohol dehydrogenase family protein [bacterium AH-315-E10]
MKQITLKTPEQFEFHDVPEPEAAASEAIIRVKHIGICGTDLHAFKGNQPFFSYPRILGHELSAEIVSINGDSDSFVVGDAVSLIPGVACGNCIACRNSKQHCCTTLNVIGVHSDGGMRDLMPVPLTNLLHIHDMKSEHAALIEPLAIGAHAVRRAAIQQGETIMVIGAGPIGIGIMQFAKVAGADVIAMDINDDRLAFCENTLGVMATVNALNNPHDTIKEITNQDFPTVVIDATGSPRSMTNAVTYLAHGGRLVFVGIFIGDIEINDIEFHKRETSLLSSRNASHEDFEYVIECLSNERVSADIMINRECSFADMINEFPAWTDPASGVIKAVITL